ncbi:MAG: hypothetical protein ACKOUR_18895 [Planctomycetota bacterium]
MYGTTKRFLQMFGLLNLNQLPRPAMRTKSRSISCRKISPQFTPRMASISARGTGCR